jgi:hypothetical protein
VLNYPNLVGTYEKPRRVPENLSWVHLALALRSHHTKPPSTLGEGRCDQISKFLSGPAAEIATIGDMQNELLMFRKSGFSIAVGNAGPDVKKEAQAVTDSYNDEALPRRWSGSSSTRHRPRTRDDADPRRTLDPRGRSRDAAICMKHSFRFR